MGTSLRDQKKERTHRLIAAAAARLFAEHGFENVTVADVARAADVAEQTVYNYFRTKEELLLDRDDDLRDRIVAAVRDRSPETTPADAVRPIVHELIDEVRGMTAEEVRGGLGHVAAVSPTARRLSLAMTDRHADAIADAIRRTTPAVDPARAKLHGVATAWIIQTVTDEVGRQVVLGRTPAAIARAVRRVIDPVIDDIASWQTNLVPAPPSVASVPAGPTQA